MNEFAIVNRWCEVTEKDNQEMGRLPDDLMHPKISQVYVGLLIVKKQYLKCLEQ